MNIEQLYLSIVSISEVSATEANVYWELQIGCVLAPPVPGELVLLRGECVMTGHCPAAAELSISTLAQTPDTVKLIPGVQFLQWRKHPGNIVKPLVKLESSSGKEEVW